MSLFGASHTVKYKPAKASTLAPAPVSPTSLLGTPTPPETSQAQSTATAEALLAAKRARKRAGASAGTIVTGQPIGAGINPPGQTKPATLGGY